MMGISVHFINGRLFTGVEFYAVLYPSVVASMPCILLIALAAIIQSPQEKTNLSSLSPSS